MIILCNVVILSIFQDYSNIWFTKSYDTGEDKTGKKWWAYTTIKREHYLKSRLTNVGYATSLYLECNAKLNHLWMIYQGCKLILLQVEIYQICLSLKSLKHSSTAQKTPIQT